MLVNNGVINIGDNNTNIVDNSINYETIIKELNILSKYTSDDLSEGIKAATNKNTSKLKIFFQNLKKETIDLIKKLGLKTLEKIIEKFIIKM